jgi:hypothetical protein
MKIHYGRDCTNDKVGRELCSMMTWLERVEK